MREPLVANASRRSSASKIASRVLASAQTPARPPRSDPADGAHDHVLRLAGSVVQPIPKPLSMPKRVALSALVLPGSELCVSVEPIMPYRNGFGRPSLASWMPSSSALRRNEPGSAQRPDSPDPHGGKRLPKSHSSSVVPTPTRHSELPLICVTSTRRSILLRRSRSACGVGRAVLVLAREHGPPRIVGVVRDRDHRARRLARGVELLEEVPPGCARPSPRSRAGSRRGRGRRRCGAACRSSATGPRTRTR